MNDVLPANTQAQKSLSRLATQLNLTGVAEEPATSTPSSFPRTRWSLVISAQGGEAAQAKPVDPAEALETLCGAYWKPIYAFVRRSGFGVEDAEDITQDFIAWFVEKDHLAEVDPTKGKLRSYFLALLRRFVADKRRRASAEKRGGKRQIISINHAEAEHWYGLEPAEKTTPDELFEKRWALSLMERVIERLREEFAKRDMQKLFETISPFLQQNPGAQSYGEAAKVMGTSQPAIKMQVHRLRKRFGELFRHEVMQTLGGTSDLDEELAHVRALFDR